MTIAGVALMAALGLGGWLAYDLHTVRHQLEATRSSVSAVQSAMIAGDPSATTIALAASRDHSDAAQSSAEGIPMSIAGIIPFADRPTRVVRELTLSASDAVSCLDRSGERLAGFTRPGALRSADGGFDVRGLRAASPDVAALQQCIGRVAVRARAIPPSSIGALEKARTQAITQITQRAALLRTADLIAGVAPEMLGLDSDRTYLVGLQTNAEARGTGGLIGGFLVVRARGGRLAITDRVNDLELQPARPMSLGPQYQQLYGYAAPTQLWQNSNLSPHFPYAAQIWRNLWKQRSGQSVDGVISVDPVALSYLMQATGPVTLPDGETVDSRSFTALAESGIYSRFVDDRPAKKAFLGDLGAAVFEKTFAVRSDTVNLVKALVAATDEGRAALWTADPAVQAKIAGTQVGHTVPYSPAPYNSVIVNNSAGSKLDYYLDRTITRNVERCVGDSRLVSVDVTLTNEIPPGPLPAEVLGPPADAFGPILPGKPLPAKENRLTISLYASWGTRFRSVSVDGRPVGFGRGAELGHPVAYAVMTVRPDVPTTVTFSMEEPALPGEVTMPVQPLARDAVVSSSGSRCAAR